MIQVIVRTNTTKKTVTVEANTTPSTIFSDLKINPADAVINLNGTRLSAVDLQATMTDLGIKDGDTCSLNSIVKLDGANI